MGVKDTVIIILSKRNNQLLGIVMQQKYRVMHIQLTVPMVYDDDDDDNDDDDDEDDDDVDHQHHHHHHHHHHYSLNNQYKINIYCIIIL